MINLAERRWEAATRFMDLFADAASRQCSSHRAALKSKLQHPCNDCSKGKKETT